MSRNDKAARLWTRGQERLAREGRFVEEPIPGWRVEVIADGTSDEVLISTAPGTRNKTLGSLSGSDEYKVFKSWCRAQAARDTPFAGVNLKMKAIGSAYNLLFQDTTVESDDPPRTTIICLSLLATAAAVSACYVGQLKVG